MHILAFLHTLIAFHAADLFLLLNSGSESSTDIYKITLCRSMFSCISTGAVFFFFLVKIMLYRTMQITCLKLQLEKIIKSSVVLVEPNV